MQNLLVCLEMLPAAIGMFYAFPHQEYKDGGAHEIATAVHRSHIAAACPAGAAQLIPVLTFNLRACCCAGPGTGLPAVGNAMHAISIHDVASDTVHQFAPTYRDYVLYSDKHDEDGKPDEAPKRTFRAKTFVPVEAVR